MFKCFMLLCYIISMLYYFLCPVQNILNIYFIRVYICNCNWFVTWWQQYSTHLHTKQYAERHKTNNTQNNTTIWESAGRAPSWLVIPWHLSYSYGKSTEKPLYLILIHYIRRQVAEDFVLLQHVSETRSLSTYTLSQYRSVC